MQASVWIRCLQLLPYFEEYGVHSVINNSDSSTEIEVFIRQIDTGVHTRLQQARKRGKKTIVDFCVNYFDVGELTTAGYGATAAQRDEALRMLDHADMVFCASEYIAEKASAYHPKVICLPDSIDHRHFIHRKPVAAFDNSPLTFVYSGVSVKTDYLFDVVYPLLRKNGFKLVVIAERRPYFLRRYRFCRWRYETFPNSLLCGEVGLAPRRVGSAYDMGHSVFKVGVFLAQGIPVIASPVPAYYDVLGKGKGGVICASPREWEIALQNVNENRELLREYAVNGLKTIEPYFTKNIVRRYYDCFCKLIYN